MENQARISLDSHALQGRLSLRSTPTEYMQQKIEYAKRPADAIKSSSLTTKSVLSMLPPRTTPVAQYVPPIVHQTVDMVPVVVSQEPFEPQPAPLPAPPPVAVLRRRLHIPLRSIILRPLRQISGYWRQSKLHTGLVAASLLIFITGGYIALNGLQADHVVHAQAVKLTQQANMAARTGKTPQAVLSTIKPSVSGLMHYVVAPNMPRYLLIPSLGVDARILSVGVNAQGALETPDNVYDTAWYNESAGPGQPGAMLIDGHISSWTSKGVFYGLKDLTRGDTVQVVRGDHQVFTYKVVQTLTYPANSVDMSAAMTPVAAGTPGLNLISCSGDVMPGTSQFDKRIIVFTELVQ